MLDGLEFEFNNSIARIISLAGYCEAAYDETGDKVMSSLYKDTVKEMKTDTLPVDEIVLRSSIAQSSYVSELSKYPKEDHVLISSLYIKYFCKGEAI